MVAALMLPAQIKAIAIPNENVATTYGQYNQKLYGFINAEQHQMSHSEQDACAETGMKVTFESVRKPPLELASPAIRA